MTVPKQRIRTVNRLPIRADGDYILYWMTAQRRSSWNFALDRAVEHAQALKKPLLIFEALRVGYRWASERLHRFVIDGMADNAAACAKAGVAYLPYVEPLPDAGKGLLHALAERACVVVADDFPCFFLPKLLQAGAKASPVLVEAVDANGILPLSATDRAFSAAVHFRRFLQGKLALYLRQRPEVDPLAALKGMPKAVVPTSVSQRWPALSADLMQDPDAYLARLPIDHRVGVVKLRGGSAAALARWRIFQANGLEGYGEGRNHPDDDHSSGISPYLHFGHLSSQQVVHEILQARIWSPDQLGKVTGAKEGWWGLDAGSEGYLDQVITWRELGYGFCHHVRDYDRYDTLPDWARASLDLHADDQREHVYSVQQLANAETHDEVWNAAQRQLLREGVLHNYLRMLWGKRIMEWTRHPREAWDILIDLNNRYALDGRNPNSYSGIAWCFGRFDRPWGPERPIYGVIRYMSSANTVKKLRMQHYLERYGS